MAPKSKKNKKQKRSASDMLQEENISEVSPTLSSANAIIDNNSNGECEEPRKKKKKKIVAEQTGTSDNKMSKRQMKREKHAQRLAEAESNSHKAVQMQALSYLSLWKHNKAEWKFNKVKQIWLHKHKFDNTKVTDELWQPFIEYFSAASGGIKQLLINDSKKVIEEMEAWIEKNSEATNAEPKPSESAYQRARDLLQNIQE